MHADRSNPIPSNLSYVLHEPSLSPTVMAMTRTLLGQRPRIDRAMRRLAELDDAEFSSRIVRDLGAEEVSSISTPVPVITLSIGATALLSRALRLSGLLPEDLDPSFTYLDGAICSNQVQRPFFRGQATLCSPPIDPEFTAPCLFAAALFRPGQASLLVRCVPLDGSDGSQSIWTTVSRLAEATIREFVLQWRCERPLWDKPAEEVLPEFVTSTVGATPCGH